MTRLLTIIALLFVTPAWGAQVWEVSGYRFSSHMDVGSRIQCIKVERRVMGRYSDLGCLTSIYVYGEWQKSPNLVSSLKRNLSQQGWPKFRGKTDSHFKAFSIEPLIDPDRIRERDETERQMVAQKREDELLKYKTECLSYGYKNNSNELAGCIKDLDAKSQQSRLLVEMQRRIEDAEQRARTAVKQSKDAKKQADIATKEAVAAGAAAEQAEKEASRASTQAIISNTIANQAKRDANTIPYGKDCPWLNGCKK